MSKKVIIIFIISISLQMNSQISCIPKIGDQFKPIKKGVALREAPETTSKIVIVTPDSDGIWLKATKNGFINNFVKVKVWFITKAYRENGVNKNIPLLYEKLKDDYGYKFNFQDYIKFISDDKNLNTIYKTLINDESNNWFKNWSYSDKYDVSTFDGFYDNWIYFDKEKSNYKYIYENEGKQFYVDKNDLVNFKPLLGINGQNIEFYKEKIHDLLTLKKNKSCEYSEGILFFNIDNYLNFLSHDNPFKAIQEINELSQFITDNKSKKKLDFHKLISCFNDGNITASLKIGKELIVSYDQKLINNYQNTLMREDIDMSLVYAYVIYCLMKENKFDEAYDLSLKSLYNGTLQFDQNIEYHSIILLNLNKKTEACELLNEDYLNGNERARELINKYCK